jgi:hypothetical protein
MAEGPELVNAALIIAPVAGWISTLYTSGAAASQDLAACGAQQPIADNGQWPGVDILARQQHSSSTGANPFQGMQGRWMRATAYGATIWLRQGPTAASVTTPNAPAIPVGTSNSVNGLTDSEPVFQNTWVDLWVSVGTRWIGYIGSGAGYLIVRPSSRGGQG